MHIMPILNQLKHVKIGRQVGYKVKKYNKPIEYNNRNGNKCFQHTIHVEKFIKKTPLGLLVINYPYNIF